jgi:uncharacterized membrane protein
MPRKKGGVFGLRLVLTLLALIGIVDSCYLLWHRFTPATQTFCDINQLVSCDIVNSSAYSAILGIPISALGILHYGFALLLILSGAQLARLYGTRLVFIYKLLLAELAFGFLFSIYLSFVQVFLIKTVCPLCIVSALLTTTNLVLAAVLVRKTKT